MAHVGSGGMADRTSSRERIGRDRHRVGSWLLGYPSTIVLGAVYAAAIGVRWSTLGALAFFALIAAVAAGERWGERAAGADGPEWPAFRRAYSTLAVIGTVAFVVATGEAFYLSLLAAATALTPAVSSIGKGLRAWSAERATKSAA